MATKRRPRWLLWNGYTLLTLMNQSRQRRTRSFCFSTDFTFLQIKRRKSAAAQSHCGGRFHSNFNSNVPFQTWVSQRKTINRHLVKRVHPSSRYLSSRRMTTPVIERVREKSLDFVLPNVDRKKNKDFSQNQRESFVYKKSSINIHDLPIKQAVLKIII